MENRVIILTNGTIEDPAALRKRLKAWKGGQVIAADGGSRHAGALGLHIDTVIGDLDSLESNIRDDLLATGTRIETVPTHKDETDLELALLHAVDQGAVHIVVLGAFGDRLDMSLANVLLIAHPRLTGVHIELWHNYQTAWLIRPPGDEVHGQEGDTLSLIPFEGDVKGINTHGLAYPLHNESLLFGPARGVSNILTGPVASVEIRVGTLLVVHSPGMA